MCVCRREGVMFMRGRKREDVYVYSMPIHSATATHCMNIRLALIFLTSILYLLSFCYHAFLLPLSFTPSQFSSHE